MLNSRLANRTDTRLYTSIAKVTEHLAISNPGYLESLSSACRTKTHFPWICLLFSSQLLQAISNSVVVSPAISKKKKCDFAGLDSPGVWSDYDIERMKAGQSVAQLWKGFP